MGLNESVNVFVDDEGKLKNPVCAIPAYIRRCSTFSRAQPGQRCQLCFDPTSGAVGKFDEGDALFADGQPSRRTKAVLDFCRNFEEARRPTGMLVDELKKAGKTC